MVEREITLVAERDRLLPSTKYAGFAGEHLATRLLFQIPEEWIVCLLYTSDAADD